MHHKQTSISFQKSDNIFLKFTGHYRISKRTRQGQKIDGHVQLAFTP